jgi:hypothetical protein
VVTHNRIDTDENVTLTRLVGQVAGGVRELFAAHAEQWRAEIAHETEQARKAGVRLAIGSALSGVGAVFVLLAAVWALQELLLWPSWAAWFAVGSVLTVGGVGLVTIGMRHFERVHWLPDRTWQSMQETWSCLMNGKK